MLGTQYEPVGTSGDSKGGAKGAMAPQIFAWPLQFFS